MVTKDTLTVPGAGGDGSHSPRIGGPGSAFKPYASSENLFDPSNFNQRKLSEPAGNNKMVVMTNNNMNYPLANGQGDLTKLTDSRSVTLFFFQFEIEISDDLHYFSGTSCKGPHLTKELPLEGVARVVAWRCTTRCVT